MRYANLQQPRHLAARALSRRHAFPGVRSLALPLYILLLLAFCAIFFVGHRVALANATVTPASGGMIPIGSAAPLSGPTVAEVAPGDVGPGNITLQAPAGFAFDPATPVSAMVSNKGSCGQKSASPPPNQEVKKDEGTQGAQGTRSGSRANNKQTKQTREPQQQKEPQQQQQQPQQTAGKPLLLSGGTSQTVAPSPNQVTVTVAQSSSGDCRATISWSGIVVVANQIGSSGLITKAPGGSNILAVADGVTGFSQQLTATAPAPPPPPPPVEPPPVEPPPAEPPPVEPPPVEPPPVEPPPIVSVPSVLDNLCTVVGLGIFSNSFGLFSDSLCKHPIVEKEPSQKEEKKATSDKREKKQAKKQEKVSTSRQEEKVAPEASGNNPPPQQQEVQQQEVQQQEVQQQEVQEEEEEEEEEEEVASESSEQKMPPPSPSTPEEQQRNKKDASKKDASKKEPAPEEQEAKPEGEISVVDTRSSKEPPTLEVTIDSDERVSFGSGLNSSGAPSSDDTVSAYQDGDEGAYYVKDGAPSKHPAKITVESSGPWSGTVSASDKGGAGMSVKNGSFLWRLGDMSDLLGAKSGKAFSEKPDGSVFDVASSCSRGKPKQAGACTYNFDYSLRVLPGDAQGTFGATVRYTILPL